MPSNESGERKKGWRPKPFRPAEPPTPGDVEQLIKALAGADEAVRQTYHVLALCTPCQRLRQAVQTVMANMSEAYARSNQLSQLLSPQEYKAYVHVAQSPDIQPGLKVVAELLLCVPDRHIVASFFRRAFTTLKGFSLFKLSLEVLRRIE